jgi:hypothetical protein
MTAEHAIRCDGCGAIIHTSKVSIRNARTEARLLLSAATVGWKDFCLNCAQGMPSEGPRPQGSGASAPASPTAEGGDAHTEGDR